MEQTAIIERINNNVLLLQEDIQIEKLEAIIDEMKEDVSHLMIDLDKDKFSTILNIKLFQPITSLINRLSKDIPSGRSRVTERQYKLKKLECILDLRKSLFVDYIKFIKDYPIYKENINKELSNKDFILEPDLVKGFPIELIGSTSYTKELNNAKDRTVKYYKECLQTRDVETYKNELYLFFGNLNSTIESLHKSILGLEKLTLNYPAEAKVREFEENEQYMMEDFLSFKKTHLDVLISLKTDLTDQHLFLKDYEENKEIPLTVFGDKNYDKLKELYKVMIKFLEPSTTEDMFINAFTKNNTPTKKLNFNSGTLAEFGAITDSMREYFIPSINNRTHYAPWWSERFMFKNKDKSPKDIRKMWTGKKDRGISISSTLDQIGIILSQSPQ